MGGPGSGRYPLETAEQWVEWCKTVPDSPSIRAALSQASKTFWDLGKARDRYPEVESAYGAAKRALATRLADDTLQDLDPTHALANLPTDKDGRPDPKFATAYATLARERSAVRRWHAERLGRADYGEQIAHAHDVTVRAVVMLPELQPIAPRDAIMAGTAHATARLAGEVVDAQVVDASDVDASDVT